MAIINSQTFNPEIVYAFDCWNIAGTANEPHAHDYTEISIMLEGEAVYTINGEKYQITANTVMIFNPGVIHCERQPLNTSAHEFHIGIRNFNLTGYPKNFMPNEHPILVPQANHHKIMEIVWQLVAELNQEKLEFRVMTKALTMQLMIQIVRSLAYSHNLSSPELPLNTTRKQNLVSETIHFIEQHYHEELTIDQIAQELLISPTYLSRVFKEVQDISLINYLIEVRMKHAALLLKEVDIPVKEIAEIVGYQDPLYFSKQFKKHYGQTPSQFKKQ